jgi:hypothetical protein
MMKIKNIRIICNEYFLNDQIHRASQPFVKARNINVNKDLCYELICNSEIQDV